MDYLLNSHWKVKAWEAALIVLVGFVLSYSWMFSAISVPNERSRVYLSVALVDEGSVTIDTQLKRFGRIHDLAKREKHYYTDKAPGSSLVGAVVYGVVRTFTQPEDWTIEELLNLMRTWVMIPFGLLGFIFLRRIFRFLGLSPPVIDIVSLGWILGTSAFHYSSAFFGHQIVATSVLIALDQILRAESHPQTKVWGLALAGFFCGLAGLTEYQGGVLAAMLALYVFAGPLRQNRKAILAFVAPAGLCLAVLLLYNNAAFGGPLELSYHHLASAKLRAIHGQGLAGVTVPKWEYFEGAFLSLHRGLFPTAPLFILAPFGLYFLFRDGRIRLALFLLGAIGFFGLFISSSNMWFAGWGFGPRLLVPVMGLLALCSAIAVDRGFALFVVHGISKGLVLAGLLYHQLIHVFFPEAPDSTKNPLVDIVPAMIENGITAPNLGEKFGLEGLTSLLPLALVLLVLFLVILLTGLRELSQSWFPRLMATLIALSLVLGHIVVVSNFDGSWDQAKRTKFMHTVQKWKKKGQRGSSTKSQARDAAQKLQNMDR